MKDWLTIFAAGCLMGVAPSMNNDNWWKWLLSFGLGMLLGICK